MSNKSVVQSQGENNNQENNNQENNNQEFELGVGTWNTSRGSRLAGWAMPLIATAGFSVGSMGKAQASSEDEGWYLPEDSARSATVADVPDIIGVVDHTDIEPETGISISYYGNTVPEWEESLVETWQDQSPKEINEFLADGGVQLVGAENMGQVFQVEFFPGNIYDPRFTTLQIPAVHWNNTVYVNEYCYNATRADLGLTESELNDTAAIAEAAENLPGLLEKSPDYSKYPEYWEPNTRCGISQYVGHEKAHCIYHLAGIDNDPSFRRAFALDVRNNGGEQACVDKGFGYWIQDNLTHGRSEAFADAYAAINNPYRSIAVQSQDVLTYFPHTSTWVYQYQNGFSHYQPALDSPYFSTDLDRGIDTSEIADFSALPSEDPAEGAEIIPGLADPTDSADSSILDTISDTIHSWFGSRVCTVSDAPQCAPVVPECAPVVSDCAEFSQTVHMVADHAGVHPHLSPNLKFMCAAASMGLVWMQKSDEKFTGFGNLAYVESKTPKAVRDAFAPAAKAISRGVGMVMSFMDRNVDDTYNSSKDAIRSSLSMARNKVQALVR